MEGHGAVLEAGAIREKLPCECLLDREAVLQTLILMRFRARSCRRIGRGLRPLLEAANERKVPTRVRNHNLVRFSEQFVSELAGAWAMVQPVRNRVGGPSANRVHLVTRLSKLVRRPQGLTYNRQ